MATYLGNIADQYVGDCSLKPQVGAASTDALAGTYTDMQLSDGPCHAVLTLGVVTGTGVDIDVKVQESTTTNTGFTDVSGGAFTASYNETTADNVTEWITFLRTKRYLRAHASITGSAVTAVPIAVTILGQKKVVGGAGYQA